MIKMLSSIFRRETRNGADEPEPPVFRTTGHCPTCDQDVEFIAHKEYFRDHFLCAHCGSIPRERALMATIDNFFPHWREAVIHETSPAPRGASIRLENECNHYIASRYFEDSPSGTMVDGTLCQNIEALSFDDESIDLHVSQDVMEHIFHPPRAFGEIARTLKPGGMHIFTVPIVNRNRPSARRARIENDAIVHLAPEQYHDDGIGGPGSLVTIDWGYDICRHIFEASGLFTHIVHIDDLSLGIRADLIEIQVTVKPESFTESHENRI